MRNTLNYLNTKILFSHVIYFRHQEIMPLNGENLFRFHLILRRNERHLVECQEIIEDEIQIMKRVSVCVFVSSKNRWRTILYWHGIHTQTFLIKKREAFLSLGGILLVENIIPQESFPFNRFFPRGNSLIKHSFVYQQI